jgi:SAM-dependent methyltransferase
MMLSNLIHACNTFSENLASPEGHYGQVVSAYAGLIFESVNHWTVANMAIQPGESVLEVGFGTGLAIAKMLADGRAAHIVGLDNSPLMVQNARKTFAPAIDAGGLTIIKGDVCRLPDFGRKFDKIVAINTTMYWPEAQLVPILRNLRHCLAPGGVLFISFQRLYAAYAKGEKDREISGYATILNQAGFLEVNGAVQHIADKEAAIAEGRFIGIIMHGTNPAFSL